MKTHPLRYQLENPMKITCRLSEVALDVTPSRHDLKIAGIRGHGVGSCITRHEWRSHNQIQWNIGNGGGVLSVSPFLGYSSPLIGSYSCRLLKLKPSLPQEWKIKPPTKTHKLNMDPFGPSQSALRWPQIKAESEPRYHPTPTFQEAFLLRIKLLWTCGVRSCLDGRPTMIWVCSFGVLPIVKLSHVLTMSLFPSCFVLLSRAFSCWTRESSKSLQSAAKNTPLMLKPTVPIINDQQTG